MPDWSAHALRCMVSGKRAEEKRLTALWARVDTAELEAAQEYVNWCRTQLGLPHWIIYVGDNGPCPDDAYADCEANESRYLAKVRLSRRWLDIDAWAQANALLHECLHVAHHQLTEVVYRSLRAGMYRKQLDVFRVISDATDLQAERMVDQLATALTDSLGAVKAWKRIRKARGLK